MTALHHACEGGHAEIARLLLAADACRDVKGRCLGRV